MKAVFLCKGEAMRKLFFVPVLTAALLCGCGKSESVKPEKLAPEFTAQVSFTEREQDFKADMSRKEDGGWSFTFTEPETIKGLTLSEADKVVSISMGGLNYIADPSQLAETSPVKEIAKVTDKLVSGKGVEVGAVKQNVTQLKGSIGDTDFTARLKKGKLLSMKIGEELVVSFKY